MKVENIKRFMQANYSDEQLAALLAHAQDGKLSFCSCCCFIGIPTADHALRSQMRGASLIPHYLLSKSLPYAYQAEYEFQTLYEHNHFYPIELMEQSKDFERRKNLLPLILEEMERRRGLREVTVDEEPEWSDSDTTREMLRDKGIKQ